MFQEYSLYPKSTFYVYNLLPKNAHYVPIVQYSFAMSMSHKGCHDYSLCPKDYSLCPKIAINMQLVQFNS